MINPEINITDSILEVKAVGSIRDVSEDFNCVQTKTIAELLNAEQQEETETDKDKDQKE